MKWLNRITSLSMMGLSVLTFLSSLKLGVGRTREPGPGFAPLLASLLVFGLSSVVLIRQLRGPAAADRPKRRMVPLRSGVFVLTILGYALFLDAGGFIVTAFLMMFALFSITEPGKWPRNLIVAGLVAAVSFFVFRRLLGVQLPRGVLSF